MKRIVIDVPGMYGDHHVTRVRELLLGADGVTEVTASAARRTVAVEFEEASTSAQAIEDLLASSGYPSEAPPASQAFPKRHEDGSGWYLLPERTTTTERKDREMAGDFRRY